MQRRGLAVEYDVVMLVCPPEVHYNRCIVGRHLIQRATQQLRIVDDAVGYQVVRYHTQIFVGNNEGAKAVRKIK